MCSFQSSGSNYSDMGSYFLTGSGFSIPEPGTMGLGILGVHIVGASRRREAAGR